MENKIQALAFFDLDGTLLNAQSDLDQEVVEALRIIQNQGILPIIATGRGHFELKKIMDRSGITGAITMNGQYIILDGQTIYKEAIPTPIITKLLNTARSHGEALAFYDDTHYWVSELTDFAREAYAYTHADLPVEDSTAYLNQEVNMLLVLTDQLSQVDYYKRTLPELNFFMNSPSSIDVTNASTNKGTGINQLKKALDLSHLPTYGFGDGRNDLHLLAACDYKTAMANAVPELKEMADFITSANTDHGIVNAFKHWGWL